MCSDISQIMTAAMPWSLISWLRGPATDFVDYGTPRLCSWQFLRLFTILDEKVTDPED